MRTLRYQLTEPQAQFRELTCKYRLFVGGFGSGKSEAMIKCAIEDALESPKALIGLYAPTYDLVSLITASKLCAELTRLGIEYKFNKVDKMIYTKESNMGDFVLRTLDKPERIVGYETYCAHIDELDTLPAEKAKEAWNMITARNRQQPQGIISPFNRVSAYSTPEGFSFIYDRWVKGESDRYKRVHAASYSNPFLPNDYVDALRETYPKEIAEAYIEGKFINMSGGNVYSAYNRGAHNTSERIKDGEVLHIGCDFNVTQMSASVAVSRKGGEQLHFINELVDMYDTPEMIETIKNKYPNHKIIMYPDASGGSRKSVDASISDIALLEQAGFEVRANKANPRVKDRILAVNTALSKGKMYVDENKCPTIASCLEQQAYDKNGEPDKKSGKDHQNDATSYLIAYEYPIRKPVIRIPVSFAR